MPIKVFISQISASKEVKKRQQRAQMILDSLGIDYELVDVTEPGHEEEIKLMQTVSNRRDKQTNPLPPQFFNGDIYCGDYEDFDAANDEDNVKLFLKLVTESEQIQDLPSEVSRGIVETS